MLLADELSAFEHSFLQFSPIHFRSKTDFNTDFRFRFLSTMNFSVPQAANSTAVSKDECREFMSVFPGECGALETRFERD